MEQIVIGCLKKTNFKRFKGLLSTYFFKLAFYWSFVIFSNNIQNFGRRLRILSQKFHFEHCLLKYVNSNWLLALINIKGASTMFENFLHSLDNVVSAAATEV